MGDNDKDKLDSDLDFDAGPFEGGASSKKTVPPAPDAVPDAPQPLSGKGAIPPAPPRSLGSSISDAADAWFVPSETSTAASIPSDRKILGGRIVTRGRVISLLTMLGLAGTLTVYLTAPDHVKKMWEDILSDNKPVPTLPTTAPQNPPPNVPVKTATCEVWRYPEGYRAGCIGTDKPASMERNANQPSDAQLAANILAIFNDVRVRCPVSFPKDDSGIKPGKDGGKPVFPLQRVSCEVLGK